MSFEYLLKLCSSCSLSLSLSLLQEEIKKMRRYSYPKMSKKLGSFELDVESGQFTDSEIIVMLGENGTGKTTFIRLMAGHLAPDSEGTEI